MSSASTPSSGPWEQDSPKKSKVKNGKFEIRPQERYTGPNPFRLFGISPTICRRDLKTGEIVRVLPSEERFDLMTFFEKSFQLSTCLYERARNIRKSNPTPVPSKEVEFNSEDLVEMELEKIDPLEASAQKMEQVARSYWEFCRNELPLLGQEIKTREMGLRDDAKTTVSTLRKALGLIPLTFTTREMTAEGLEQAIAHTGKNLVVNVRREMSSEDLLQELGVLEEILFEIRKDILAKTKKEKRRKKKTSPEEGKTLNDLTKITLLLNLLEERTSSLTQKSNELSILKAYREALLEYVEREETLQRYRNEIDKKFRALAFKTHSDTAASGGDDAAFTTVKRAYALLRSSSAIERDRFAADLVFGTDTSGWSAEMKAVAKPVIAAFAELFSLEDQTVPEGAKPCENCEGKGSIAVQKKKEDLFAVPEICADCLGERFITEETSKKRDEIQSTLKKSHGKRKRT